MRILTTLLFPLFLLACTSEQQGSDGSTGKADIPALNDRAPGLDAGDFAKVRSGYDRAVATLEADPENIDALVEIAGLFAYEARVTGDHPYYYPAALSTIDRALAVDPDHYESIITKTSILLSLHRFEEALEHAERAVELAPNAAAPYGALVDAYVELGELEKAVEAADRMVEIRPDLKSYARVSYMRELHDDMPGATEAMKLAVSAGAPGSEEKAWARTTLGEIYMKRGLVDSAEREYLLAVAERKDYPFALAGLADVEIERGRTDSAERLLDRAIALVPEFSFVEKKADIARAAGDSERADSLVTVVASMLAEDEAAGHTMNLEVASLYAAHGTNLDEARRRVEAELALRPKSVAAKEVMKKVVMAEEKK